MLPSGSTSLPSKKGKEILVEEINNIEGKHIDKNDSLLSWEEEEVVPEWIHMLTRARFWKNCEDHNDESVSLFCLRCYEVVCPRCIHDGPNHHLLKVRRYVYRSVVLVKDMQELGVDVSRIQTYIVNSHKGVHLRPMRRSKHFKPQPRAPKCLACSCWLRSAPHDFCSLSCKGKAGLSHEDFSGPEAERRHKQHASGVELELPLRQPSPTPLYAMPMTGQHHTPKVENEDKLIEEANMLLSLSLQSPLQQSVAPSMADHRSLHNTFLSLRRHPRKQAKPQRAPFF